MSYILPILGFLKKHWLPIILVLGAIGIYFYGHHKGTEKCEAKIQEAIQKELEKQQKEEIKLEKQTKNIKRNLKDLTDKKASCILSNNPYKKECKK